MRPAITFKNSDVARQWKSLHMPGLVTLDYVYIVRGLLLSIRKWIAKTPDLN